MFEVIIPKPDLVIFLKVSPEIAYSRKPELSKAEHLRQQNQMHYLTSKFKHFKFVSTDFFFEESQTDFLDGITKQFKNLKGWN